MTTRLQRERRRREGTAMAEVVLMLPFFFVAFAGTYYLHGLYNGRQIAATKARACLWAWASKGCTGDRPPSCEPRQEGERVDRGTVTNGAGMRALEFISDLPLMPDFAQSLNEVFGTPTRATSSQQLQLPAFVPADSYNAWRHTTLMAPQVSIVTMCNAAPKSWTTVAKETFCQVVPDGFPGCP